MHFSTSHNIYYKLKTTFYRKCRCAHCKTLIPRKPLLVLCQKHNNGKKLNKNGRKGKEMTLWRFEKIYFPLLFLFVGSVTKLAFWFNCILDRVCEDAFYWFNSDVRPLADLPEESALVSTAWSASAIRSQRTARNFYYFSGLLLCKIEIYFDGVKKAPPPFLWIISKLPFLLLLNVQLAPCFSVENFIVWICINS
jgi:hypothetical protein